MKWWVTCLVCGVGWLWVWGSQTPVAAAPAATQVQDLLTECRAAYFRLTDYRGTLRRETWTSGHEPHQEEIRVLFRKPGFLVLDWQTGPYAGTTLQARPGWNNGNFLLTLGGWFNYVKVSVPLIGLSEPFVPNLKDVHEWLGALLALSRRPASDRSLQLVRARTNDPQLEDGQILLSVPAFLIPFRDNAVAVYEFIIERGTGLPVGLTLRGPRGEIRQRLVYSTLEVNTGLTVDAFDRVSGQPASTDETAAFPQTTATVDIRGFVRHWGQRYAEISDYTGVWTMTTERAGATAVLGQLPFKFRRPFDVYVQLDGTTAVLYRRDWNAGRIRVRTTLGGLPIIGDLDPGGYIARRGHPYPITDFGLDRLVERIQHQLLQGWLQDELEARFLGVVRYTERPCYVFEFVFPNSRWRIYPHYRMVMYWDIGRRIPIKLELFDWNDRLAEGHAFHQLRLNVSLSDADFQPTHPSYDFLLFERLPWLDWFLTGRD